MSICPQCKKEYKRTSNSQKYCSKYCRYRAHKKDIDRKLQEKKDREASVYSPNKIKCLICNKYYIQVGSHITQKHGMTAREYKEYFGLEVKKGLLPAEYREIKKNSFWGNPTLDNLKKGKKYWFKKGVSNNYKRSKITIQKLINNRYKYGKIKNKSVEL